MAVACNDKHTPFLADDTIASGEKVKLHSVDGNIIEVGRAFLKPVPPTVGANISAYCTTSF